VVEEDDVGVEEELAADLYMATLGGVAIRGRLYATHPGMVLCEPSLN
jgi:hypothetical protein